MSNPWQHDDNPYPRYTTTAATAPPRIPLHRRPRQDGLHRARPRAGSRLSVAGKEDLLTEEHEGNCAMGVGWAFLILVPFYGGVGWAIAALLRAAIH